MASSSGNTKISDVLEILSVQTISDDIYRRIPPSSNLGNKPWSYEREKQIFTDAVHYCMVLLRQSNRLTNFKSDVLSMEATLTGHEMFERIRSVEVKTDMDEEPEVQVSTSQAPARKTADLPDSANDNQIEIKEEVMDVTDSFHQGPYIGPLDYSCKREKWGIEKETRDIKCAEDKVSGDENSTRNSSVSRRNKSAQRATMRADSVDENNFPPSQLSLTGSDESQSSAITRNPSSVTRKSYNVISLDFKRKVVELVKKHPDWSLKQLQEHGCDKLNCLSQIPRWTRHVMEGGTQLDKFDEINKRTYEKLVRALLNAETVSVEKLRQWAIAVSRDLHGAKLNFNATKGWVYNFKKLYDIRCSSSGNLTIPDHKIPGKSRKLMKSNRRRTTNN